MALTGTHRSNTLEGELSRLQPSRHFNVHSIVKNGVSSQLDAGWKLGAVDFNVIVVTPSSLVEYLSGLCAAIESHKTDKDDTLLQSIKCIFEEKRTLAGMDSHSLRQLGENVGGDAVLVVDKETWARVGHDINISSLLIVSGAQAARHRDVLDTELEAIHVKIEPPREFLSSPLRPGLFLLLLPLTESIMTTAGVRSQLQPFIMRIDQVTLMAIRTGHFAALHHSTTGGQMCQGVVKGVKMTPRFSYPKQNILLTPGESIELISRFDHFGRDHTGEGASAFTIEMDGFPEEEDRWKTRDTTRTATGTRVSAPAPIVHTKWQGVFMGSNFTIMEDDLFWARELVFDAQKTISGRHRHDHSFRGHTVRSREEFLARSPENNNPD